MAQNWYYAEGEQKVGPISSAQLRQLATAGRVQPTTLVLKEGSQRWVPAISIKGLFTPAPIHPLAVPLPPPRETPPFETPVMSQAGVLDQAKGLLKSVGKLITAKAQDTLESARQAAEGKAKSLAPQAITPQAESVTPGTLRRRVWPLVACAFGLLFVLGLCVSVTVVGLGHRVASQNPAAGKGPGGAAAMTKADFKKVVMSFHTVDGGNWDGVNDEEFHLLYFLSEDFYKSFGKPSRTQTLGKKMYWYWECKDGTVQVVFDTEYTSRKKSYDTKIVYDFEKPGATKLQMGELVGLIAINDY